MSHLPRKSKIQNFTMSKIFLFSFSCLAMLLNVMASANFSEVFDIIWAPDHITTQGDNVILTLDQASGCGFMSKSKYLFGRMSAQIKVIEGDSAGTVTAFYLTSDGPIHDELDFEFLGNVSGEPYLLQTNVFANRTGYREQKLSLWFDPTADFHNYSFFWNQQFIIFQVDDVPIRVFERLEQKGVPYLSSQPMGIHGSLWNGEYWATQGGKIKINWSHAPFKATFRGFEIDACALSTTDDPVAKCGKPGKLWWDRSTSQKLDQNIRRQIRLVQDKYLVYDYCKDTARFPQTPPECQN